MILFQLFKKNISQYYFNVINVNIIKIVLPYIAIIEIQLHRIIVAAHIDYIKHSLFFKKFFEFFIFKMCFNMFLEYFNIVLALNILSLIETITFTIVPA